VIREDCALRARAFSERGSVGFLRSSAQDDKGVLTPLSSPKNFLTKNLVKLAAQTRYGAIKSAPLIKDCKHNRIS